MTSSLGVRDRWLEQLAKRRKENPDAVKQAEREQYAKHKEARKQRDKERYERSTDKIAAKSAINHAIRRGELLPANRYFCAICYGSACDHHHPSYQENDRLNVVPLCRSCHVKVHHRDEVQFSFGAVVLPVGVIRIAIAGGN